MQPFGVQTEHSRSTPPPSPSRLKSVQFLLRSLHSRNYRLFFMGHGISLIGTWMQQVAVSWLIYRLSGSGFLLGVVAFSAQFPAFLMAPVAGVVIDRCNRQRLFLITQICSMFQATLLAFFVLSGFIQIWQIIVLSSFLGFINAFDMPLRQSLVIDLVEKKEDLSNAIALNSSLFNSARLIGPSIAGVLVASLGEGVCFAINAISYLAVIVAITAIRIPLNPPVKTNRRIFRELKEGFDYVCHFIPIRNILALFALTSFMGMPYVILLPVFAREILRGDARTYGFLMAAIGIGALCSTLYLASRRNVLGLTRVISVSAAAFGFFVICFAFSSNLFISLVLLFLAGFAVIAQIASSNTILQTIVDNDKRGRVMSFYTMALMGSAPLGGLAAGYISAQIGVRGTLAMCGLGCLAGAIIFARTLPAMHAIINPIYEKMGILSEADE